jgi:hypothetical protein
LDGPEYTFKNPLEGDDLDNLYEAYGDEDFDFDYGREGRRDDQFELDYGLENDDYGAEIESTHHSSKAQTTSTKSVTSSSTTKDSKK